RPWDGLLHAAGASQAVLQRVHGRMDRRRVSAPDRGLWAEEALVLGGVYRWPGDLASLVASRSVVLAANPVVESAGRRVENRARVATGEIHALGRTMGADLGHADSEHECRQHGRDLAGNTALALQYVPSANRDGRLAE